MCGRLVVTEPDLSVFVQPFQVRDLDVSEWLPRFNLAPTQLAPLITNEAARRMTLARFGLVPSWSQATKQAHKLINARVEGVSTSKAYGRALRSRRGIVPVTGYIEWQTTADGKKRPLFIHDKDGKPIALAALWDRWRGPEGERIESFAVLTRPSSGFLTAIHSRMPLELQPQDIERWLSPETSTPQDLAPVLHAEPHVEHLRSQLVSQLANSPQNDGPECIAEAADTPEPQRLQRQLDLFESIATAPSRRRAGSRTR
jgi:putative SOS response-associated peptidase YedK